MMMIHSQDNTKVETKITDEGDLFVFCPECRGIWQTSLNVIHEPKEDRTINYGGAGITLAAVPSGKAKTKKSSDRKAALAKELFPEAYK
ncbi:MAG: hypothetical protein ABR886_11005 [Dehalococcoidales bacterium]